MDRLEVDRSSRDDVGGPTISRFFGILMTMYFDDHDPPHVYARDADGRAKLRIDALEVLVSTLDRR